jgi:hypothetical protein
MKSTALVLLAALAMAGAAHAQTTNQNKPNTNLTKPANTVNNIRPADPPRASTGTVTGMTGTPASAYHPPAAPTMKSVDTTKVPPPQTSKGTK